MNRNVHRSAAIRLLLACARWFCAGAGGVSMREAADAIRDWDEALDVAAAHGLDALVAWCVAANCGASHPRAIHSRLRANLARNLALSIELISVLRLLRENRIDAIPIKGPVLAAALCGASAWRASSDVDVLVRPADITRAKKALADFGYRTISHLPWEQETARLHWNSQMTFVSPRGGLHLDLHWRMLPCGFPCARWFDSIWERAAAAQFEGEPISAIGPEDLLLYLCAHAAKHSWQSLCHAVDIALAMRLELDWELLFDYGRGCGGIRILATGLWMAHRLLGAPMPAGVQDRVESIVRRLRFAPRLVERITVRLPEDYATPSEFKLQIGLADGIGAKLRYAAAYALLPTEADAASLRLPYRLSFLYYPYRQARLAFKYGGRIVRALGAADASPARG